MIVLKKALLFLILVIFSANVYSQSLTENEKSRVASVLKNVSAWGNDPKIISIIKTFNAAPKSSLFKDMNQEKWSNLSVLSPEVKELSKNELAKYLASKKSEAISEIFVSGANGEKVAFLAKTSNWSHKGKPKHDIPMSGKTWTGAVELDESTGLKQVQISFPVIDSGKPIGSIVVGIQISKL